MFIQQMNIKNCFSYFCVPQHESSVPGKMRISCRSRSKRVIQHWKLFLVGPSELERSRHGMTPYGDSTHRAMRNTDDTIN